MKKKIKLPHLTRQFAVIRYFLVVISRGGSRRVVKFLSESNSFHIKSKAIKKNLTLLDSSMTSTRKFRGADLEE